MNLRPLNVVLGKASTDFIESYLGTNEPKGQAKTCESSPIFDKRYTISSLCCRRESRPIRSNESECHCPGPGLAVCETAAVYIPRNPEESVLYGAVAVQLETFLERQHLRDRIVPRFVERELRSFLECGILANGFLRVHCDACRLNRVVPFSCYPQRETICSSNSAPERKRHECFVSDC